MGLDNTLLLLLDEDVYGVSCVCDHTKGDDEPVDGSNNEKSQRPTQTKRKMV
jgi:hypothetical protein